MPSLSEVTLPASTRFNVKTFQRQIVDWFLKQGRKLPWRESDDPYRIWISESMCQQTGVSTVIPYYERFLKRFPSVESLANASEEEVLKYWEGLGYYQRARNLRKAAQILVEKYQSQFPKTREELLTIPGIGPYTAGAILSLAFRISTPALDGNLIRVYSRFFGINEAVDDPKVLKKLWQIASECRPAEKKYSREFAEGLMDLGAQICTPKSPRCLLCPIRGDCKAFALQIQDQIPFKAKKVKRLKKVEWVYWNLKRQKIGFLSKGTDPKYPDFYRLAFESKEEMPKNFIRRLKYSVTHRDFEVFVTDESFPKPKQLIWFSRAEAERILLPAIDRKILNLQVSNL